MIDNQVKNILLECLNENIKIEGMMIRYNLFEGTTGSSGGSTSGGPGITGGGGGSTPGGGSPGGGATGSRAPGGATGSRAPGGGATGGGGGGGGSGKPTYYTVYGSPRVIPPAKPFIPDPMLQMTHNAINSLIDAGELGVVLGSVNRFSDMVRRAQEVTGTENAYGAAWLRNNLANIIPKQEALRKEGMGYTKGWAAIDTSGR